MACEHPERLLFVLLAACGSSAGAALGHSGSSGSAHSDSSASGGSVDSGSNAGGGGGESGSDVAEPDDSGSGFAGANVDSGSAATGADVVSGLPPNVADVDSGSGRSAPFDCDAGPGGAQLSGTAGVWQELTLPGYAAGDRCQAIVVDPVNPRVLTTACGNDDGRKMKWYVTTDYGDTWKITNASTMNGNPWGFSIDPNPNRNPCTWATLYSPAGYGSLGAWKSTDGAATWTRLTGADAAFSAYNPSGAANTDLYHIAVLPDDPPNHVLATYHYYFKNNTEGGFGETWDGGRTWAIHPPPVGVGTSHYVLPISGTTWCVIAQSNGGANGIWRTTTAGRTGGTAAKKFRDGTISSAAWTNVTDVEHVHGSYTPMKIGSAWYTPGLTASEGSVWKSADDGATWRDLLPGYYWPSPPNKASTNKNVSGLVATANYIYGNYFLGPDLSRAPVASETAWVRDYTATPGALSGVGANPMANAVTFHAGMGKWVVFMGTNVGLWRYIEP